MMKAEVAGENRGYGHTCMDAQRDQKRVAGPLEQEPRLG